MRCAERRPAVPCASPRPSAPAQAIGGPEEVGEAVRAGEGSDELGCSLEIPAYGRDVEGAVALAAGDGAQGLGAAEGGLGDSDDRDARIECFVEVGAEAWAAGAEPDEAVDQDQLGGGGKAFEESQEDRQLAQVEAP